MKAAEIREMSVDDLRVRERDLDDQLFRLRIQKSMGQLEAPAKVRGVRRDLARIKTILREKAHAKTAGAK
jgi:large subunit ribosomal protein L29